ncbi:fasciclin domain-containing protein [Nocardioides ungokensis]|uniref:fasciclin domain-containing protein n=1 Tax=Nocardioides ungokensis TaxID=1643322 RepID=UPI0015DFD097|nr:fasciclin domain-containing protein [Nocardioides ungokensis]
MKIRFTATALATVLAAGTAAAAPANASPAPERSAGTRSLATVLAADGTRFDHNWRDFDIVEKAVLTVLDAKPDSPVGVLTKGRKRVTAFIPTDAAFRRLVTDLTGHTPQTERATFKAVASVADVDTLEAILLYHVVPGATITSAQAAKADGAKLKTAQGGVIKVNVTKNGIRLIDRDPDAPNARVLPRALDINKGNRQIAHGISQVLRPANL